MKLRVTVVLALRERQEVVDLGLEEGATIGDAIAAADLAARMPQVDPATLSAGLWSKARPRGTRLRDGDRVELYRPLQADAKAQRRARARLNPSSTRSRNGR